MIRVTDISDTNPAIVPVVLSMHRLAMRRTKTNAEAMAEIARKQGVELDEAFRLWHDKRLEKREEEES